MSENRLLKFLVKREPDENPLQFSRLPVLLSDSKGVSLERFAPSSLPIKWLCRPGARGRDSCQWLLESLDWLIRISIQKKVVILIWLGTCDVTRKDGAFISLRSGTSTPSNVVSSNVVVDELANTFRDLKTAVSTRYPTAVKVLFLETPVFSIEKWNESKGHKNPTLFRGQDIELTRQIDRLNIHIREINSAHGFVSPQFSLDLQQSRKDAQKKERYRYNFTLYRDGAHPKAVLAKVWLARIEDRIKLECR